MVDGHNLSIVSCACVETIRALSRAHSLLFSNTEQSNINSAFGKDPHHATTLCPMEPNSGHHHLQQLYQATI